MEYKDFVELLRQRTGKEKGEAEAMIESFCRVVTERCAQMDSVTIQGLGTFEARKKMERISVNPTTGQRMLIPPKIVMVFKPNTYIKNSLKGREKR